MSESVITPHPPLSSSRPPAGPVGLEAGEIAEALSPPMRYAASLLMVALAACVAFGLQRWVGAANLTLIFVLPVIASATSFGWGPSLLATAASVLAFDFFFTEPLYSLTIANPADLWAAVLLAVIGTISSAVAARSRQREVAARHVADQAQAIQALAHVVIDAGARAEVMAAAAVALSRIFRAPSVIFVEQDGAVRPVASAGHGRVAESEREAARGVMESGLPARAEAYPYPGSTFEFWPVPSPAGRRCVIGVGFLAAGRDRPAAPEGFIDIVSAYLAAALGRADEA